MKNHFTEGNKENEVSKDDASLPSLPSVKSSFHDDDIYQEFGTPRRGILTYAGGQNLPENYGYFWPKNKNVNPKIHPSSSQLKVACHILAFMNAQMVARSTAISMRLLVIEDEQDLRRGLEQALREEGYAVDSSAEGTDGLYKAETWDYDAIVLDVMLPGMDGWEILQRLRQKKKTPVLLLTARDSVRDRVRGLNTGADDYLIKPFDLGELLARVRALIRRASDTPNPVVTLGAVRIDTAARTVAVDGADIALTAREYALLEYLALRRGKVVSRTQLYDHLFAEEDESFSNLLDVHVCNLRRKLGKDLIQTRRGHGYVVE